MKILTTTIFGVQPVCVEVECDLSPGLAVFQIVGLPDVVLRESKVRVKSALLQSGFNFPYDKRIVLNLSPSRLPKEGSALELAMAAKILEQTGQMISMDEDVLMLGELGLDGTVRTVPEINALVLGILKSGAKHLVLPAGSRISTSLPPEIKVTYLRHLRELTCGDWLTEPDHNPVVTSKPAPDGRSLDFSMSEYWANLMKIMAFGEHRTLLVGPPGCGKTFFAERVRFFLGSAPPEIEFELKVLDALFERTSLSRPFEAPHHSATLAGLVGGGNPPRPGAVTRAHGGILFLDEVLEFSPHVLDALREILETHHVQIARASRTMQFPARVLLIAAANPCRCGHFGSYVDICNCRPVHRQSYQNKISGPLFDRFEIKARFPSKLQVHHQKLVTATQVFDELKAARDFKKGLKGELSLDGPALEMWEAKAQHLSLRGRNAVQSLGRTLACLDHSARITSKHLLGALRWQGGRFGEETPSF